MGLIGESLYGLRRGEFGGFKGRNNMCRNDLRIQVKSRDLGSVWFPENAKERKKNVEENSFL